MITGSLVTQREPSGLSAERGPTVFTPARRSFFFASLAALAYGTSPIIIRQTLFDAGPFSGVVGGTIAYGAASAAVVIGLLIPSLRRNVMSVSSENARWFVYSGIVAAAQGFSIAPSPWPRSCSSLLSYNSRSSSGSSLRFCSTRTMRSSDF
jgi:hypothetical protein